MIFENPLHRRHVLSEHREDPPLSDNARTVVGPIYGYGLVVHDLDGRTRRVSAELLVRKRQDAAPVSYVAQRSPVPNTRIQYPYSRVIRVFWIVLIISPWRSGNSEIQRYVRILCPVQEPCRDTKVLHEEQIFPVRGDGACQVWDAPLLEPSDNLLFQKDEVRGVVLRWVSV